MSSFVNMEFPVRSFSFWCRPYRQQGLFPGGAGLEPKGEIQKLGEEGTDPQVLPSE